MRIAIFGKRFEQLFYEKCSNLFSHLEQADCEVYIYKPFYKFLTKTAAIHPRHSGLFSGHKDLPHSDLIFSIGGDGTFLDAATIVGNRNIPMVGINSGRLGFLADISKEDLPIAINEIIKGNYTIKYLDLLKLEPSVPCFGDFNFALNELAVQKIDTDSMITIHTYQGENFLNSYWADGLIVATPTGSTAYSMSVGGPIIHPSSKSFVITPIAPHNLTVRPIVVPNDLELSLQIEGRGGKFLASLDSRSCILDNSTKLKIKPAEFSLPVIELKGNSYYSTLRSKLMWGVDKRN